MSASIVMALWLSAAGQVDAGVVEPKAAPEPVAEKDGPPAPLPKTPAGPASAHWYDHVTFGGFGRIGVYYTFPFQNEALVGGNGGFRLADARLNVGFQPVEWANFVFSIEAAAPVVSEADATSGQRIVSLRDWYANIRVCKGFLIRAGQFRPPYYAELLQPDGMLPFSSRSIVVDGIPPPDAYGPRRGIVPDRQVGVMAYSERLGNETVGFKWAFGVFNGNGQNQLFNDNNAVTPTARLEGDLWDKLTLGVNAFYNVRADGTRPNRVTVNQLAYGADLTAKFGGLKAMVAYTANSLTYDADVLPPDGALGLMAQVHYVHEDTGLEGAARFALLDASTSQIDDRVMQLSAMVGYRPFKGPIRIVLEYEHREEEAAVAIANDSLILFLHAFF